MKFLAFASTLALASASKCPGSESFIHAKCDMSVSFTDSCADVQSEMTARQTGTGGWADPHNGGTYTFTNVASDIIEGTRTTGDGKYTDKYIFSFTSTDSGCDVSACSESQVMSVLDYSTNYCNLHSLYCNSADGCPTAGKDLTYTEKYNSCSQHDDVCVANAQTFEEMMLRGSTKATSCPPVTTAENFDLDAYISGRWYIHQQAETKYLPIEQNYCVTANYDELDKKSFWGYSIQVSNYAEESDGTVHDSGDFLCAKQTEPDTDPAKLAVSPCFLPSFASGPYWVLEYDESEGYALISGGQPNIETENGCRTGSETNDSGLWIFTRSQARDEALIQKVRQLAAQQGFDLTVLNDVDQTNCPSYNEEVSTMVSME